MMIDEVIAADNYTIYDIKEWNCIYYSANYYIIEYL